MNKRLVNSRLLGTAANDDQLLPEQGILGNEIGFAMREVDGGTDDDRIATRLGEMREGLFKGRNQTEN